MRFMFNDIKLCEYFQNNLIALKFQVLEVSDNISINDHVKVVWWYRHFNIKVILVIKNTDVFINRNNQMFTNIVLKC